MKVYCTFTVLFFSFSLGIAQEKQAVWNSYMATHEKAIGATNVRMDLINDAPVNEFDYLCSVQILFKKATEDGLPNKKQLDQLYRIKDSMMSTLNKTVKNYYVGSFTYQNFRREFFYTKDTLGFKKSMHQLFEKHFNKTAFAVRTVEDATWDVYRNFLYPNNYIRNFMYDRDAVLQLQGLGDDAEKARKIEFFATFANAKARDFFMEYLNAENYTISENTKTDDQNNPYQLVFWKESITTLDRINELTSALVVASEACSCMYEGWETIVIKKKKG